MEDLRSRFSGQKKKPPVKETKKNKDNAPSVNDISQEGSVSTPVDASKAEELQAQVTAQVGSIGCENMFSEGPCLHCCSADVLHHVLCSLADLFHHRLCPLVEVVF